MKYYKPKHMKQTEERKTSRLRQFPIPGWLFTIFQIPAYHTLPCLYQAYPVSWFLTFAVEAILFLFLCREKQKSQNTLPQRSIA